jgi:hypothetical protein
VYGINRVARGKAQGDQSDSSSAIADFLVSDEADLFIFWTRPFPSATAFSGLSG